MLTAYAVFGDFTPRYPGSEDCEILKVLTSTASMRSPTRNWPQRQTIMLDRIDAGAAQHFEQTMTLGDSSGRKTTVWPAARSSDACRRCKT